VQLAPGITCIGEDAGGSRQTRGYVRAFLVEDGKDLTLIDTLGDDHPFLVLAAIRRLGRSITDLQRIWLTHAHFSHLCGLAALKRLSGATVASHQWEAGIISGERKATRVSIVPKRPLRAYYPFQIGLALGLGDHKPCEVDEVLEDQHEAGGLTVFHTPGHTPGHFAFWHADTKVLLSGDAIVTWPELAAGWDSFTLDEAARRESLGKMAALRPEKVGVGHGDPLERDAAATVDTLL
jgi:glyoxylase-like metal-dependent hydrolase (beta-lactamase superfamily II)